MPYRQPDGDSPGAVVGAFDGVEIPRRQEMTIGRYRERMRDKPTAGEAAYYAIADRIVRRTRRKTGPGVRFVKQREFFITHGFSFIVDCFYLGFRLGVEIDGGSHLSAEAKAKDEWRTRLLLDHERVRIVRFTNEEVVTNPSDVCQRTVAALFDCGGPGVVNLRNRYVECGRDFWAAWRPKV